MSHFVTATLTKHSTDDGLITILEHVPIGKQYEVDLDSIEIAEFHITDVRVNFIKHPSHSKEIIWCKEEDGLRQWMATELLFIPGHTARRIYTHKDKDGVLWRFEGGRPISEIADEFMDEFGFNEKRIE